MPIPGKQLSVLLRVPDDPNDSSTVRNTRLELPADPTEILDALHRLGREAPGEDIEVRIEDTAKPYLRHLLGTTSNNLMEVDLLAQRLSNVTLEDSAVLHALIQMSDPTTDIPRLINLTYAMGGDSPNSGLRSDAEQTELPARRDLRASARKLSNRRGTA